MSDLTAQQALGMEKIKNWYGDRGFHAIPDSAFGADVFRWFGYAGTGKTFTAARIPEALGVHRVAFGTYTGKAASVLRRSLARYGAPYPVTTIHSAIYMPTTSAEARAALKDAQQELFELGLIFHLADHEITRRNELEAQLPGLEANARRLAFEFNPDGPWADLDLIILDEVSMVNAKLAADIESYGVPILVLGDPAQLPPVEGGGYYTDAEPDHMLTDVQRQAVDNPVLELATRVRQSTTGSLGLTGADMTPASVAEAMEHDQVLCWTNRRRWAMITVMRRLLQRPEGVPVAGDKIMCLTNNKDIGVFNGEQFEVLGTVHSDGGPVLKVRTEAGAERVIQMFADGFQGREMQDQAKSTNQGQKGFRMLATFAQAITVHKAQGSEWDSVYLVNETPGMISMTSKRKGHQEAIAEARRWVYTGATRAKEKLTITRPSTAR